MELLAPCSNEQSKDSNYTVIDAPLFFIIPTIKLYCHMFNPQRKVKMAEIYMEERAFQLHLQKMKEI